MATCTRCIPRISAATRIYAFCPDACSDPSAMAIVNLTTQGTVLNASLAVTSDGLPRVLMSTGIDLYFAECNGDCTDAASWDNQIILQHEGDRAISDGALALDAADHPRFVMNTSIALLGIGQKAPEMYVGYQAEDLSGGASTTDPTKPACLAGADMVLTRLALMR